MGKHLLLILIVVTSLGFRSVEQKERAVAPDINLISKIEQARAKLGLESVDILKGVVGTRRVKVGRRKYREVPVTGIVGREMAIAVLDGTGDIRVARAIKRDKGLEVLTPGFNLMVRRDNGINSDIFCAEPGGGKVLAVKYPVSNEGNRFQPGGGVIQAVYTPYSPEVVTEEIIKLGMKTQAEMIDRAYERLSERRVYSHAFPGKLVVDVVPKDVLTVLLMNEHIDPAHFKGASVARPLVNQVLTIIATNREKAYAYSVSSAGARGLVQMIPSTYSLLSRKYPSAGLMSNFALGMVNTENAIIAQVLLCDADWQSIRTRRDILGDKIGPYLAAAYNGGVGRVLAVLKHEETEWMESPDLSQRPTKTVTARVPVKVKTRRGRTRTAYVLKSYTQPIFRSETNKYIAQYHWINDYLASRNVEGSKAPKEVRQD